jgi:hypothetical protein
MYHRNVDDYSADRTRLLSHIFCINVVKTETILYAEMFELDDWEDLGKFVEHAVTKVRLWNSTLKEIHVQHLLIGHIELC